MEEILKFAQEAFDKKDYDTALGYFEVATEMGSEEAKAMIEKIERILYPKKEENSQDVETEKPLPKNPTSLVILGIMFVLSGVFFIFVCASCENWLSFFIFLALVIISFCLCAVAILINRMIAKIKDLEEKIKNRKQY